jgi:type II secretory pathway pseudopilin PulG
MVTGSGGWPGYSGGASTAAGSAMNGMAGVISARGDAALSASAAAVNLTQAQKQEIQNRQAATNAYWERRATDRAARAAERGPPLTSEQLAKIAHAGVPKPLTSEQLNPVTGQLNWPGPLQQEMFATRRVQVDQLMAQHSNYGSLPYAEQCKLRDTMKSMFKDLKAQIKSLATPDYIAAKTFLNSLLYATTKSKLS